LKREREKGGGWEREKERITREATEQEARSTEARGKKGRSRRQEAGGRRQEVRGQRPDQSWRFRKRERERKKEREREREREETIEETIEEAGGRRQETRGRRQEAGGRRQEDQSGVRRVTYKSAHDRVLVHRTISVLSTCSTITILSTCCCCPTCCCCSRSILVVISDGIQDDTFQAITAPNKVIPPVVSRVIILVRVLLEITQFFRRQVQLIWGRNGDKVSGFRFQGRKGLKGVSYRSDVFWTPSQIEGGHKSYKKARGSYEVCHVT